MGRPKKEAPNREDGLYEVKCTIGKTFDGKLIRKSFYSSISKGDARRKAEEYRIAQAVCDQTGEPMAQGKGATFGQWAAKWLENYKRKNVKEHTFIFTYKVNVEKYLIPYFGAHALTEIRQADIQGYFNKVRNCKKPDQPLAGSTLDKHKLILKDVFETAIDNDLCFKNPVKNIKYPNVNPEAAKNVYNAEQVEQVKCYAREHIGGEGIIIILNTGMRRSELCGLRWGDIDFDKCTIHVQNAVVPTNGKLIESGTKSKSSNRIIPISKEFSNWLAALPHESKYVIFGSTCDKPINPDSYSSRHAKYMKKMSADINLPERSPHELRHTFGTVLRENGVDIYTIQKVMGHSDISITCKVYVHNDLEVLRKNLGLS